jgi:phosphorylase kinase alpha/beta subunit
MKPPLNERIAPFLRDRYGPEDLASLQRHLRAQGTFAFRALATGLYPAAAIASGDGMVSGYENVWVRDNVYVALAHEVGGETAAARATVLALASFYLKHRARFEDIIEGRADPQDVMRRPHVRFDGARLVELPVRWAHAQNDALGYFLWIYGRMAAAGHLPADPGLVGLFVRYFEAIRYWQDADSGHWEETRKVQSSSIGAVVAGLTAASQLRSSGSLAPHAPESAADWSLRLDELIGKGRDALGRILPAECIEPGPGRYRPCDAALLFLVYPLDAVGDAMGRQIVQEVLEKLQGDFGIRRYLGDSYWTADYKQKLPPEARAADVSERQQARDALASPGQEAQWCIFDPIVSVIAGRRYLHTGDAADLERQVHHLNRSLLQLTGSDCPAGALRCPEAYYLERGRYVPNDHVPLLWTQANLWLALEAMAASARRDAAAGGREP